MQTSPTVSVLMTAYNREAYIAQAIESVLASGFEDYELIIVDDASRDGTVEVARQYSSDQRVRVYVNEANLGDYANRNRAAELSRGTYLKYVDSDDILYPHGLEIMVDAMRRYPQAGLGICRPPAKDRPYPYPLSPRKAYLEHFFQSDLFNRGPLSAIIRADAFRSVGGFSGKRFIGDRELWFKLAARHPVVKLADGLAWWRMHESQEYRIGERSLAPDRLDYLVTIQALLSDHCPLSGKERDTAIRSQTRHQVRRVFRQARKLRFRQAYALTRSTLPVLAEIAGTRRKE